VANNATNTATTGTFDLLFIIYVFCWDKGAGGEGRLSVSCSANTYFFIG
jgi:hypothetical protein